MATKLTAEEIKYNSIIATQTSLIELGAIKQKEQDTILQKELKYTKLCNTIVDYNTTLSESITTILTNVRLKSSEKNTEILKIAYYVYNYWFSRCIK